MKKLSETAEKIVVRERRKIESIECDMCKRLIKPTKFKSSSSRYFEVVTGHHDWGEESGESREHFDICPNCIAVFVLKYTQECSDTGYLEMESEHLCEDDFEYV